MINKIKFFINKVYNCNKIKNINKYNTIIKYYNCELLNLINKNLTTDINKLCILLFNIIIHKIIIINEIMIVKITLQQVLNELYNTNILYLIDEEVFKNESDSVGIFKNSEAELTPLGFFKNQIIENITYNFNCFLDDNIFFTEDYIDFD